MSTPQERALSVLTNEWQQLPSLRTAAGFGEHVGAWGFADLVFEGRADVKHEPITRHGIAAGFRLFYRRAAK